MNIIRGIGIILSFIFVVSLVSLPVRAESLGSHAVIIHQIRGPQTCCHGGTSDIFSEINSLDENKNLPLAWALRYDALVDSATIEKIKNLPRAQSLGILLEITPQLASASAVNYKGESSGSDWYSARNAFLIGYTQTERKQLIDTVFGEFHTQFGYFPTFTVAWMVDAWSLKYIHDEYGVELHEITKEQYETDSYTLYGGIFDAPYYPSLGHPLIPAPDKASQLDLVMVRQTISDLDRNYGSSFTYFTSQPNDYLQNPKTPGTNYFTSLLDQMIAQKDVGLILLGLENSAEWVDFKAEYQKQLAQIVQKQKTGEIKVFSPHEYAVLFKNQTPLNSSRMLKSPRFPEEGTVLWYFGRTYRARIQVIGGDLLLTDLRNFSPLTDVYQTQAAQVSRAYWIVPYTIDGSQQYTVKKVPSNPDIYAGHPVRSDDGVQPFGIKLSGASEAQVKQEKEVVEITVDNSRITLEPDFITTNNLNSGFVSPVKMTLVEILSNNTPQFITFAKHPRFFIIPDQANNTLALGWETPKLEQIKMATITKDQEIWKITPLTLTDSQVKELAPIFQPDLGALPLDPGTSTFYWANTTAIAGRNPIRLFVVALSILSRPTRVQSLEAKLDEAAPITAQIPGQLDTRFEPFFVDFVASRSAQSEVALKINGNSLPQTTTIKFYTDCQKEPLTCFMNRDQLKGFVSVLLQEKIAFYTKQIKDLTQKATSGIEEKIKKYLGR
ncbi:MAG: hypothetical protein UV61_C0002G0082 [Candidatus Gottesmanbacteria bacterium GW2011_GWB1_43_11]|uniref:Uncharacterized protein n=1 Tax=Candidatus Gottesmanbacteria bacterium GW2011_GWB1_43_11 TaxID=1618446 RepID=A0A0G1EWF9_9BACT|nr:MAG: hypothetical protein UV61_C0002G0082 [Candidatus Gottesmanbacteria bacterium GW2011_GWB1_43_11]OGG10025.1 MAG: hypothetical protein A2699_06495 [Candidatus Gottesmanbacteria bacterium RIFCSPHIGHO2_01_FULL_43_15]